MLSDEAFIRAIAEQPHDGLHRAVHADWLDDHGQPERAELVRAQCELERLPPASDRALALRRRTEDLLAEHESEWMGEWAERLVRWEWRGGYPHSAIVEADVWARHGAELMRAFPLSRLGFVDREGAPIPPEAIEVVVRHPAFAIVRALDPECDGRGSFYSNPPRVWASREWVRHLAALPGPTWLEKLNLADGSRDSMDFPTAELAGTPALAGLRSLRLEGVLAFGAEDIEALAKARFAGSLTDLDLGYTGVGLGAVGMLATEPAFSGLRRLDLMGCRTGDRGLRAILTSSVLERLTSLAIDFEQGLGRLANSPRLHRFAELTFHPEGDEPRTDEGGWRELVRALDKAQAPSLRALRLEMSGLSADCFRALLSSPGLAGLWSLRLSGLHEARPLDWGPLAGPDWLPLLADLDLEYCPMPGLGWLAGWAGLSRLRSLRLRGLYDGGGPDDQLRTLLASPYFAEALETFELGCTEDDDGISAEVLLLLARCPRLGMLRDLALEWTDIQAEFIEALDAAPSSGRLTRLQLTGHTQNRVEVEALADPRLLPRLRELSVSRKPEVTRPEGLRERFGPRLRVWS